MKKILLLFTTLIFTISLSIVEINADESLSLTSIESANYICDRLEQINEYAIENGGTGTISKCKFYSIEILEVDEMVEGILIDFNGDNGYVVVGEDLVVYEFKLNGASINDDFEKNDLKYDVLSGFTYEGIENNLIYDMALYEVYDTSLDGVASDGTIEDLPDYVADVYGTSYTVDKSVNATTMTGEKQSNLSVYLKMVVDDQGIVHYYSEGNCGLVGPYNLLKFYRTVKGYYNLPTVYTTSAYDPSVQETDFYNEKVAEGNYKIFDTEQGSAQRYFTPLYVEARLEAIDMNDSTEGLTVWESRDILNNVMENHNYSTRFKIIEVWLMSTVTSRIDNGEAILWSTIGSAYGDHTMFVAGYDIYVKETKILFVTYRTYKNFFELRDGWNSSARYYDFNGFNGGTVFGAFVVKD